MTKARSNATANAAKGDLTVGNGTNLSGVLGVGSNGDTLVADSSTATGLRYTAGTVQSNPIINSAFQVWQRGTSFTNGGGASVFGADRWQIYSSSATGRTWSRQATNDTTNLPNIQYCLRLARNSGDTQTNLIYTINNFETVNSIPYAGKTVTLSFYARAGANYSSASNAFAVGLLSGTGTDQNSLAGYTGQLNVIQQTATLTTTWQRFTFTGTVGTNVTELGLQLGYTPTGTAGANDWAELTGVQLDIGSVALPFRTYAGSIQGELAACQRYYWRQSAQQTYSVFGTSQNISTTQSNCALPLPVSLRTAATSIEYSTLVLQEYSTATLYSITNAVLESNIQNLNNSAITFTVASGLTGNRVCRIVANNSTSAYLAVSAEL